MLATESHNLCVGGVIAGVQSEDHMRMDRLQMMQQDRFFRAWPYDQDLPTGSHGLCDLLQE